MRGYCQKLTLGPSTTLRVDPMASLAINNEISLTRLLTSFALAFLDRSWLNFALRQGCCETWTFDGRSILRESIFLMPLVGSGDGFFGCGKMNWLESRDLG